MPKSPKIALISKLLKPLGGKFGPIGVAAVILFVLSLSFGLPSQAKAPSAYFWGGFGAGGDEEVINGNSLTFNFTDDLSSTSFSCFLNPRLSFPQGFGENWEEIPTIGLGQDTIFSYNSPLTILSSKNSRSEVITHTVVNGENPWTIAAFYGISANTVLWANNLSQWQYVRTGQELVILPVSGIRHQVKNGDTVEKIAQKYRAQAEKIITFNNLAADKGLELGEYLVVPDGEMPAPPKPKYVPPTYTNFVLGEAVRRAYAAGHCTWYVAQKRTDIPSNWGNAKNWIKNALAAGYSVCQGNDCVPQKGAIVSVKDSGWMARLWGHVAYVEEVNGDQITISEMNHVGRYKVNNRTLSIGDKKISGYIY